MLRRIEHLITGKYEPDAPELITAPERLTASVPADSDYAAEINIGTEEDVPIRGFLSTDSPRVTLSEETFRGTSVSVRISINVRGLRPGDTLQASVTIVSSAGEKVIPIELDIEEAAGEGRAASIETLDEFTALSEQAGGEALRLFSSRRFPSLLTGEDEGLLPLYRALSRNPVTAQRLEAFLVASGRKKAVTVSVDQPSRAFYHVDSDTCESLRLTRHTWGLLNFRVETEGSFLEAVRRRITDQDFIGSVCDVPYIIHADRLGRSCCYGRLILTSDEQRLVFEVTASRRGPHRPNAAEAVRKSRARLMRLYLDFRMNRLDTAAWSRRSLMTITAVRDLGPCPVDITLYEAYVAWVSGDKGTAARLVRSLQDYDFSGESLEIKGSFLYLCHVLGLLTPGSIDVKARLRDWYQRCRESSVLMLILMQVDDELARSPGKKLRMMEEMDRSGCSSPLLYMEAVSLLRWQDSLLRLNAFTRRVLLFAARYDLMTEALYNRVCLLADNEKAFRPQMYRILTEGYDRWPSSEALEAICRHIMKGEPARPAYFRWYAEAVDKGVRLTRLYEFYIETIPPSFRDKLPLPIRKYFLLSGGVSRSRMAFIYANIVRNKTADPGTYDDYLPAMGEFTARALMDGAMDENYAVLYREFYPKADDRVIAGALAGTAFTARLYCDDPRMREVVVVHGELEGEICVKLKGGTAYIPLYTPEAVIAFCDARGARYASGVAYSLERLSEDEALTADCLKLGVMTPGLVLHACRRPEILDEEARLSALAYIADSDAFTTAYREKACRGILAYFTDHPLSTKAESLLSKVRDSLFVKTDRIGYLETLLTHALDAKAWYLMTRCGYERVNPALMMPLVSRRVREADGPDDSLLKAAFYVFSHDKYDDSILTYLMKYYTGPLDICLRIRQSAAAFYLETYDFDERILMQAMFVRRSLNDGGQILHSYRRQGGRARIVLAMMTFESHQAFRRLCPLNTYTRRLLEEAMDRKWELDGICLLALLQAYADQGSLDDEEERRADRILEIMAEDDIRLGFCRKLPRRALAGYGLEDRIFVETFAGPKDRVTLYYRLSSGPADTGEPFVSEPLREMCYGLYSREFVLFYGEVLTWYLKIEHNGVSRLTPERTETMARVDMTGRSRYQLINQMLSAQKLGKTEVLREKLRDYSRLTQMAAALFRLKEEGEDKGRE